jgi:hypothetical protein
MSVPHSLIRAAAAVALTLASAGFTFAQGPAQPGRPGQEGGAPATGAASTPATAPGPGGEHKPNDAIPAGKPATGGEHPADQAGAQGQTSNTPANPANANAKTNANTNSNTKTANAPGTPGAADTIAPKAQKDPIQKNNTVTDTQRRDMKAGEIDKHYRWADAHWYYLMPDNSWMVYEKDHWVKTSQIPQQSSYQPEAKDDMSKKDMTKQDKNDAGKSGTGTTTDTKGATHGGGDCSACAPAPAPACECGCRHHHHHHHHHHCCC